LVLAINLGVFVAKRVVFLVVLAILSLPAAGFTQDCVRNCEQRGCGDDGCGGSCGDCQSGFTCYESSCHPHGLVISSSFEQIADGILPIAMVHWFASKLLRGTGLAKITIRNVSTTSQQILVKVQIPFFSEANVRTELIPAGQKKIMLMTPSLDFEKMGKISSNTPAKIEVSVSSGGEVLYSNSLDTTLVSRNIMFWSEPGKKVEVDASGKPALYPLAFLLAGWVTPNDNKGAVRKLVDQMVRHMPNGSVTGYQENYGPEKYRMVTGQQLRVVEREVVTQDGTKRLVAQREYVPTYEVQPVGNHRRVAQDHLVAIFNALRERNVKYVNAPEGFFEGSQFIRYPSSVLSDKTANCIEGSLVFASALEALAMRPVIILIPGHAFVGVRSWLDDDIIIPIETTMVSKLDLSAVDAINAALDKWKSSADNVVVVDMALLRKLGFAPWPD
jgi:hypothetical protein